MFRSGLLKAVNVLIEETTYSIRWNILRFCYPKVKNDMKNCITNSNMPDISTCMRFHLLPNHKMFIIDNLMNETKLNDL